MNNYHVSVLLQETIKALNIQPDKKYIDGTIGGAGHGFEVLKRGGKLLGIDVDGDALAFAEKDLKFKVKDLKIGDDLVLVKGNFKDIDSIANEHGFDQVAGILLDIGVSSHHLDSVERGFSFQKDGPLDMRMDQEQEVKARDLVNILTKGELYELFTKLGEERFARAISQSIVIARQIKPIQTTTELAEVIRRAVPWSKKGINPATKVFQALRIAVNDELHSLTDALPKAVRLLENGGRLVVISFHSLEDRIVKRAFIEFEENGLGKIVTKKPVVPSEEETSQNKRSRSAKLRVFEKTNQE